MATETETKPRTRTEIEQGGGPKDPSELITLGLVNDVPANKPESSELQQKIESANALIERKREVLSELQKFREACTILTETGSGSRDQVAWVRYYLPRKERKKKGDNGTDNGEDE